MVPLTLRLRCVKQRNRSVGYRPEAIVRTTFARKWRDGRGFDPLLSYAGGPIFEAVNY